MRLKTKDFRRIVCFFVFAFGLWSSVFGLLAQASTEPLYTLSAKVSETQPQDSTFAAHFRHPATGEQLEYLFKVTAHTGMNGIKSVQDLKSDDLLQIDYFKAPDGSLIVEYMKLLKMDAMPDGLAEFNPLDLLKKKHS